MSGQKPSKPRVLDALVGAGIAAVIIIAATFGDLGPVRHSPQVAAYGAMQVSARHRVQKAKTVYRKANCPGQSPCSP